MGWVYVVWRKHVVGGRTNIMERRVNVTGRRVKVMWKRIEIMGRVDETPHDSHAGGCLCFKFFVVTPPKRKVARAVVQQLHLANGLP